MIPPALVDPADTDFTGLDPVAVKAAADAVRAYCRWHIAPSVTEDLVLDGSGGPVQFLPTLHLTALTSITNDGVAVTDPEWSAAGMVRAGCWMRWTCKWRGVTASITHGYDMCPDEIVDVIAASAKRAKRAGLKSRQVGGVSTSYESTADFLPLEKAVLGRYRLPVCP